MADTAKDPNELVQMNCRVPQWLRDRVDARRAGMTDPKSDKPLSRDKWVVSALKFALEAPERTPTTNTRRRTAPPRRSGS